MQQLRLFPRTERLPVLVLDDGSGPEVATLLRRLRRAARLDPVAVHHDDLGPGPTSVPGHPGTSPAAVVARAGEHPASIAALRRLVALVPEVPVVAVVDGGREGVLAALQAGAEEVVESERSSAPALERAVLAAVTRRVADRRDGRGAGADPLTGLATRAQLDAELPLLLGGVAEGRHQLALLYCDLDRLKVVNDSLGHGVGDAVLVEAAARLRQAVRSSDVVVRVGGDEFVVVLRGEHAASVADEVARRIVVGFTEPVQVEDHRLPVGVSVGLAVARPGESPAELVGRADRALYLAKRRGRGRVARAEPVAVGGATAAEERAERLRDALVRDRLALESRAVVAPGGRLVGHRVAVRWDRAVPGLPEPGEVAEDAGMAPALFAWLARRLGDTPPPSSAVGAVRCFVDLPRGVLAGSPARRLEPAFAGGAVEPSTLVLLVDERHLLDADAVRPALLELARSGVRVGVSGFGAVHGALAVLERHPFDSVWLDRDSVEGLAGCAVRRARLHAVVGVAAALGQQVVAPCPTRAEDAAVLAAVGGVAVERPALDLRREPADGPAVLHLGRDRVTGPA